MSVATTAPRHPFDEKRLAAWMRVHVTDFGGELAVEQFAGGQSNPTYRIEAGGRRFVLRRKPPGELLPSAHAVDREYRVMRALADTDVPVPRVYALCEDTSVIGTAFFVMECLEGRIFFDPALPGMRPDDRAAIFEQLNRVIAALHRVDRVAVGLADYGRPGNYLARQIERWTKQYRASETDRIDAMDRLIEWLPANVPDGDETSIVHGDYRLDNVVFHRDEPRILGVLDWELSTLGHPVADFAYHVMTWRVTPGQFRGLKGHDLAALGIPDEQAYVAAYCRRTGRASIPDWDYYLAFNMFRMAAILQGIRKRALQGNAASPEAVETGERARPMAEAGWAEVERMRPR
jgi:aminoglycoside phosphotransferase (APT) family kinase protein